MTDWIVGILLLAGCLFCLAAALGLLRMPDIFCRMQSSSKGTTLGIGLVMLAVAIHFHNGAGASRAAAVVVFIFATSPVAAHMLSRASYLMKVPRSPKTEDTISEMEPWNKRRPD